MKPFILPFSALLCFISGSAPIGYAEQAPMASHSAGAILVEGKIAVTNTTATANMPDHVTLKKITWDPTFGNSATRVTIPGTPYAIPLVGGKVTPVIIREHPLEVWKIEGIRFSLPDQGAKKPPSDEAIGHANRIVPAVGQLLLILTGGEIHETWTLDFTDAKKGLQIRYQNGSGW